MFNPKTTCALIADGGCPCPENHVKCGQGKIFFIKVIYFISLTFEAYFSPTYYQTLITTTLAGAQMFAATNRLKKPVTATIMF
jgi:hypothetical protein